MIMKLLRLVLVTVFASNAFYAEAAIQAAEAAEKGSSYFLCRNQKTVRTIRIENDQDDKQCVTVYTKAGVDKEVARAQNPNNCQKILENIKTNLEAASWKCKEISDVRVTSSVKE